MTAEEEINMIRNLIMVNAGRGIFGPRFVRDVPSPQTSTLDLVALALEDLLARADRAAPPRLEPLGLPYWMGAGGGGVANQEADVAVEDFGELLHTTLQGTPRAPVSDLVGRDNHAGVLYRRIVAQQAEAIENHAWAVGPIRTTPTTWNVNTELRTAKDLPSQPQMAERD